MSYFYETLFVFKGTILPRISSGSVWYAKSVILPICLDLFLFLIYQTSLIPLTKNVSAFTFQISWLTPRS